MNAFGIEHTPLSKSFVPGEGFKAASKLSQVERHIIRNKASGNKLKYKKGLTPEKVAPSSKGRRIHDDWDEAGPQLGLKRLSTKRTGKVLLSRRSEPVHVQGMEGPGSLNPLKAQAFPDGKGGGVIRTYKGGEDRTTLLHEKAHLTPKRNPVRFRERALSDPKRNGREEGRADFVAHGKATPGQYPGNDRFKEGYNEVQTKLSQAAFRRKLREK